MEPRRSRFLCGSHYLLLANTDLKSDPKWASLPSLFSLGFGGHLVCKSSLFSLYSWKFKNAFKAWWKENVSSYSYYLCSVSENHDFKLKKKKKHCSKRQEVLESSQDTMFWGQDPLFATKQIINNSDYLIFSDTWHLVCFQISGDTDLKDSRVLLLNDVKIKLIFQSAPSFQTAWCDPSGFRSEKGSGAINPHKKTRFRGRDGWAHAAISWS